MPITGFDLGNCITRHASTAAVRVFKTSREYVEPVPGNCSRYLLEGMILINVTSVYI